MAKSNQKKRNVKVEAIGQAHIQATFNNIIISRTNKQGQVISWSSAGKMGFRGSKKNTTYAAETAAKDGEGAKKDDKSKEGVEKKPDEKKPAEKKPANKK